MATLKHKTDSAAQERWRVVILFILIPVVAAAMLMSAGFIKSRNFLCWNGVSVKRHTDGKPWLKTTYRSGLRHGLQIEYYTNGQKRHQKRYHKGKLHGQISAWTDQGQLADESHYANGKRHGTSTTYDRSGNIFSIDTYDRGVQAKTIQYVRTPNGERFAYEGEYKKGKPFSGEFMRYIADFGHKVYTFGKGKLVHSYAPGRPIEEEPQMATNEGG